MKKMMTLVLALVLALSLTACGNAGAKDNTPSANRLEDIKARGYLEMVTEPYFVPYEFIDSSKSGDEQYVGVDIELGRYIAQQLGVELRIVPMEFGAVLAGITESKYDMAISALAYSPARAEVMNLSKGYYFSEGSGYGFLVRSEDVGKYTSIESLADAVIVTQSGSVQEGLVNDQVSQYGEFKRVSAMTDGFLMVGEGKADVCICEKANGQLYADANPGYTLAVVDSFAFNVPQEMEGTRVGMPLGEEELTDFVNQCIDELTANGQIESWYSEYAAYAKTLGVE